MEKVLFLTIPMLKEPVGAEKVLLFKRLKKVLKNPSFLKKGFL